MITPDTTYLLLVRQERVVDGYALGRLLNERGLLFGSLLGACLCFPSSLGLTLVCRLVDLHQLLASSSVLLLPLRRRPRRMIAATIASAAAADGADMAEELGGRLWPVSRVVILVVVVVVVVRLSCRGVWL